MSEIKDGGPAFPVHRDYEAFNPGMSLRDYFAAKAMATFMHGAVLPPGFDAREQLDFTAKRAYEVADALLKARKQ
jgi:hypothetical protein